MVMNLWSMPKNSAKCLHCRIKSIPFVNQFRRKIQMLMVSKQLYTWHPSKSHPGASIDIQTMQNNTKNLNCSQDTSEKTTVSGRFLSTKNETHQGKK